ncbi:hypothetical protein A5649_19495 [Mycolicibacter heraklionensis]|uniref:Uncharacterized protein n=1 Tax=Mycolicibacter heraklionensis TaxID=512402 RepID=A0AA91IYN9_9MYCO|nr:hypothetical protein [Mycolicibacter heraklionensis]OBK86631.1 hypothetical protein A5649_19495 [Mycolicibacter heraklionensis]
MTTLIQPDPNTLRVSYHPRRTDGDAISIQCDDPAHGRIIIAFTPELADRLATLLATATTSPRIGAAADQLRAAQRECR